MNPPEYKLGKQAPNPQGLLLHGFIAAVVTVVVEIISILVLHYYYNILYFYSCRQVFRNIGFTYSPVYPAWHMP